MLPYNLAIVKSNVISSNKIVVTTQIFCYVPQIYVCCQFMKFFKILIHRKLIECASRK